MEYRISKGTIGGKRQIKYACPGCGESLHSPLDDAGRSDFCPDCGTTFVVPAEAESNDLRAQERESIRKEAEREKAKVAQEKEMATQREQEAREAEERARVSRIILTTTPSVEGRSVVRYLGIQSVEIAMDSGVFSETVIDIRDIFEARSEASEQTLGRAKQSAMDTLRQRAADNGANAVVAVDLDYKELDDNRIALILSGTMVKLRSLDGHGHPNAKMTPSTVEDDETGLFILSFLIPVVGFIVGAIRLANTGRNTGRNGGAFVGASFVGTVVWIFFIAIANAQ